VVNQILVSLTDSRSVQGGFMKKLGSVIFLLVALVVSACNAQSGGSVNNPAATNALPATTQASAPAQVSAPTQAAAPTATSVPKPAPPSATATLSAPSGNPFDVIMNAQRAQLTAKTFRSRTTTTLANGKTSAQVVEYVAPDRVHLTLATGDEIIVIKGVGTFRKVTGGQWTKSPVDMSATAFAFLDPKNLDDLQKMVVLSQVKFVGPELLDNKPMFVYQYATLVKGLAPGNTDLAGTSRIWIGATDGLPYKLESEQDSAITKGEKTKTVITLEYDSSIKIEAPIK
jgi:hypothetical protein